MDGGKATRVAFDTARALMAAGVNFEFVDADSLARARVGEGRLEVADFCYRVLVFPAMETVRWSSLEKAAVLAAVAPDTRAKTPVRSLHRKIGPRDVYRVMDAPRNSAVEFRARGQAELWDPWTGDVRPLRLLGETATHTTVELPLDAYEAQVVVFSPGPAAPHPPSQGTRVYSRSRRR